MKDYKVIIFCNQQMNKFVNYFSFALIWLIVCCSNHSQSDVRCPMSPISYRLISNTASSRGSAYIDVNKIVTTSDAIFFVYLDNGSNEFDVVIRKVDKNSGNISDPIILGTTSDNHGSPAIAIDDHGFLWVAMGGHSREMLVLKSVNPYDIEHWEKESVNLFGRTLTYQILNVWKDNVYILVRSQMGNEGARLTFMSRKGKNNWLYKDIFRGNHDMWIEDGVALYDNSGYNRFYANMIVSELGVIHVCFQNYEYLPKTIQNIFKGNGTSYCLGYLYSEDGGDSWKTTNGNFLESYPACPSAVDLVAGNSLPSNPSWPYYMMMNMVMYAGNLYIAYSEAWPETTSLFIASLRKGKWIREQVYLKDNNYIVNESSFSIDDKGEMNFLLTCVNRQDYISGNYWGSLSSRIKYVRCDYNNDVLQSEFLLDTLAGPIWLPNWGKSDGSTSYFLFTRGNDTEYVGDIIHNELYLGEVIRN